MQILTGVAVAVAAALAVYHMYAAGVSPFTALVHRPVHLGLLSILGFLGVGIRGSISSERNGDTVSAVFLLLSAFMAALAVASCAYMLLQHEALVRRVGDATFADIVAGTVAIIVVIDLARRTVGWGLVVVAMAALGYALLGPWLPGILAHRGYGWVRVVEHLFLGTEGIWGVPLGVSADFVFLFILFGAVLDMAGGGDLLIGLAARVAGTTKGGPAKTAAVASAFMGSLSGSAVANVVTTGSLTIPMMIRTGFRPATAGAIEAAASTGGQLMPPIMGAGAFILATWTNIPYARVALAALIPAILYYVALFAAIHFQANRRGLEPFAPRVEQVRSRLHLLMPLVVIVALLASGRSPMRAAFWGVVTAVAGAYLFPATRLPRQKLVEALTRTAGGAVQVAAACAAAGIVVGVASLTGIGLRMSELIVTISGGQLPVALFLTAVGSIVLGMGLPTTAAYVVLAALGAPALVELGVPLLAAHLFIFYFGALSNITPPVSLAAYAAAGIAGAPAMGTALMGVVMAATGFVIPFVFVYRPALLLTGSVVTIVLDVVSALLGVVALSAAAVGFMGREIPYRWRAVMMLGSLGLLMPSLLMRGFGLVCIALVTAMFRSAGEISDPSPARVVD